MATKKRPKKARRGRPPVPKPLRRDRVLSVRLTQEQRQAVDDAAGEAGQTVGEWCVAALMAAARKVFGRSS